MGSFSFIQAWITTASDLSYVARTINIHLEYTYTGSTVRFFEKKKHIRFDTDDKFVRVLSVVFQQYSVRNNTDIIFPWIRLQKPPGLSWSLFVGTLGMPGT